MKKNNNLHAARKAKNDEFYTRLFDIETEMKHYWKHFVGKTVYLNCDNHEVSQFWLYFKLSFQFLGLKKLIATGFNEGGQGFKAVIEGGVETLSQLEGDGDFRSAECVELLKESDIVVTNPPFSLFREFVGLLMEQGKQFLVIGNNNAITYKEVFKHIKNDALWLGMACNKTMEFQLGDDYEKWDRIENGHKFGKVPAISWFTNLTHRKRQSDLILFRSIKDLDYPKYDNYAAIEVSRVCNIPVDYEGVMGVPITFLEHYNPEQFEILGNSNVRGLREHLMNGVKCATDCTYINGKAQFARILIRKRQGAV